MPFKEKRCRVCGDLFVPVSSRQLDCNKEIIKKCAVCGKEFTAKCSLNDTSSTCSKECKNKLSISSRQSSYPTRKCLFCGKEFQPKSNTQRLCESSIHMMKCVVCGKEFELDTSVKKNIDEYRKTCSDACLSQWRSDHSAFKRIDVREKSRKTMLSRYGVEYPAQNPELLEKQKATMKERYGAEFYAQSARYKKEAMATNLAKYGTEWPMQNEEIKEKQVSALQSNYGVDNPMQSDQIKKQVSDDYFNKTGYKNPLSNPDVQSRITETVNAKFGVGHYSQTDEFKEKFTQTSLDKFGTSNPMQSPSVKAKAVETNLERYGSENYLSSEQGKQFARKRLEEKYRVEPYPCLQSMEEDVVEYLQSIDPDLVIECHCRTLIAPNEVDIYLPQLAVAIECNPTATHNSSFPFAKDADGKPLAPSYHQMKTTKCQDAGVFLFHIFGYEWNHKREIIELMLANIIGKNTNKIYARKCNIVEVDNNTANQFFNENHRQGQSTYPIRLGLEYQGELVSLMAFGHMRETIGKGKETLDDCYELVRFCSKLNTSVVGGASRLFKHFVREYDPPRIRSFSDRAHTRGSLYSSLGFTDIRHSDPSYVWVDTKTDIAYNRSNTRKSNLPKSLNDSKIDLSQTESSIMKAHGFAQVFDSGTITWEWIAP